MGFSPARGDTLNVTNAPFDGVDKPAEVAPALDWWRDPANLPLAKEIGKYALILAIVAFLYYRILRPLLRQVLQKFDKIVEVPEEKKDKDDEPAQAALGEAELEEVEEQQQVQGYRANLQMAKDLARDDPRVVANVIKSWVGANE
jgi:flagellar M-ring protein FliF